MIYSVKFCEYLMFLYLNYEERFILQNGDVNDFSYNFVRVHTYTRLYTLLTLIYF